MNRRPFSSFHPASLVFAAVVLAVPAAAFAQADVPRTADGRPDLSGVWNFSTATPMQRPEELAGKDRLTAEEAAEYEARLAERRRAGDSTSPTASLEARVSYEQAIWFERCMKRTIERLEAEAEIYRLQGLDHVAEIIEDCKGKIQSSLDIFLSFDSSEQGPSNSEQEGTEQ